MNRKVLSAAILAVALSVSVSAKAQVLVDGVRVLVPGQTEVNFLQYSDAVGSPEFFVGSTALPLNFTSGTVFLLEPVGGEVSDVLTILLNDTGGVNILFYSSPATIPLADILPHQLRITETGQWQDVSSFFGQSTGFAQVVSDLNVIPEPTTWAMMLAGFGMIGAMLRRSRRRPIVSSSVAG
jgi:hypothetical protein